MLAYSSKDFGKTHSTVKIEIPSQLLHSSVESNGRDPGFSEERAHPVYVVDLPTKTISVTIGHLHSGQSTRLHRHTYETVLVILSGQGRTFIEDRVVEWKAGDAVYVPTWAWHRHENLGEELCRYVACENAPLLQNLGNLALREER